MATKIYSVGPDVDDTHAGYAYFSTKARAMEVAKRMAAEGKTYVQVIVHTVRADLRRAQLFAYLLNDAQWSASSEIIFDPYQRGPVDD